MKRLLIAGATGYLGQHVLKEAKKQGYWIRALIRNTSTVNHLTNEIDEVVIGEATDPATLTDVCEGIDVVFSSVGITKQKDGLTYMDVDYQANMNLFQEALKQNVQKFIYVSALNAKKMRHLKMIDAKEQFVDALKKSRMDHTIIRPNGFYSDMLEYLQMAQKGKGFVFGSGEYQINPIHGQDLAEICVQAINSKLKEINVGGPEIFTHNQILDVAFQVCGKPVKTSRIPIWIRNTILTIMRMLTPIKVYGPLEFFMTVLATDMIAPQYGQILLKDYYQSEFNKGRSV